MLAGHTYHPPSQLTIIFLGSDNTITILSNSRTIKNLWDSQDSCTYVAGTPTPPPAQLTIVLLGSDFAHKTMPSPCIVLRYDTIWCAEYDTTMLNHDLPNVANRCHPPLFSFQYLKCHPIIFVRVCFQVSYLPSQFSLGLYCMCTGKCICN